MKHQNTAILALLALTAFAGSAALAETGGAADPLAEAQAFLASPTSLTQAIATAETAAGGKVAAIEYQTGENGAPDLIMADVILADGTEKTVAINPADGKVLNVTLASNDGQDGQDGQDGENGDGGQDGEGGGEGEPTGENASN